MVPLRLEKDLGLVHQPAERLGVDDPVNVPLVAGADLAGFHGPLTPFGANRQSRVGRQVVLFPPFGHLTQRHWVSPLPQTGK